MSRATLPYGDRPKERKIEIESAREREELGGYVYSVRRAQRGRDITLCRMKFAKRRDSERAAESCITREATSVPYMRTARSSNRGNVAPQPGVAHTYTPMRARAHVHTHSQTRVQEQANTAGLSRNYGNQLSVEAR